MVEGLLRAFSFLSKCFFFNLPFNMEKHLVPNQYIKEGGIIELQHATILHSSWLTA